MADGRQKEAWNHTSHLLALVATAAAKRRYKPTEFHPFVNGESKGIKLDVKTLHALKPRLVKDEGTR